jgi:hypothetical protein
LLLQTQQARAPSETDEACAQAGAAIQDRLH